MNDTITFALLAFTSYFSIVNPLSTMPVFMTMTNELDTKAQRATGSQSCFGSFYYNAGICPFRAVVIFPFLAFLPMLLELWEESSFFKWDLICCRLDWAELK